MRPAIKVDTSNETKSDNNAHPQDADSHPSVSSTHPISRGIIPGLQLLPLKG